MRKSDKKGDVNLVLELCVKSIESRSEISHIHPLRPADIGITPMRKTEDWKLLVYAYDEEFNTPINNMWILSGNGGPPFIAITGQVLRKNVRISSSDWIHDFAPKLELGEYFVVEIPKGNETIKEAWELVKKAEEAFMSWNDKGVYANCREVGYLLNRVLRNKLGGKNFDYKERWGRAYSMFKQLASLHLHLEQLKQSKKYGVEDVKISRIDAEHLLLITKALIKYAEGLLRK